MLKFHWNFAYIEAIILVLLMGKATEMLASRDFEEKLARLRDGMNEILSDSASGVPQPESISDAIDWIPSADVLENKDDIVIRVDIPGMSSEEIDLAIAGDVLVIKGERNQEMEREDENYHAIERDYGKFSRHIQLPTSVDMDNIKASYKNGVLTIRLPKIEEYIAGRIEIGLEQ